MWAAAESTHRQIETRGAELALVIAVGREIDHVVRPACFLQCPRHGPVDAGVTAPAAFVCRLPTVAEPGQHEAVLDTVDALTVVGKPGDCPDCSGNEQEPVAQPPGPVRERRGKQCGCGDAGGVVVGHAGVADMSGDKKFPRAAAGQRNLGEGQRAVGERRVDMYLVLTVRQLAALPVAQAEPPGLVVIGGAVGHPVGVVGQGVQVR